MEIERQISEAPDICAIITWDERTGHPEVIRFENEDGDTIAKPGEEMFEVITRMYVEEIEAARSDFFEEMDFSFMRL